MEKPKKQTRRALKEKDTSYNARFVLRYQNTLKIYPKKMKKNKDFFDNIIDRALNVIKVIIFTNIIVMIISQIIQAMN